MPVGDKIDIAIGISARSKSWKNQKWLWPDLVKKLTTEYKTNEKYKEFVSASKQDQLKIKDVGGYVGGFLRNGRRKPENVLHRQLVTLDIDNAHPGFWDDFTLLFDNAAVLHGTHKHSPTDPRYRLVMPLSRECTPDEYVATSRYVAGVLGIDLFDNTTFQIERLMFWPSSSADVEYYAVTQEGPWLDVDEALASYTDWTDSSSWPTSESSIRAVKNASEKQEDPEVKRGMVGAFCRTYTIEEAIEKFLSNEYTPSGDGRYTFANGTAASGLVLYNNKFAFSHHGTDPCSGKLCNAFDLVRIHMFGHLDTSQATTEKTKSFAAMEDFCRSDREVKKTIALEKLNDVNSDFVECAEGAEDGEVEGAEDEGVVAGVDVEWATELELDSKGKYLSSANNISIILANDPRLAGAFRDNLFDDKKYIFRSMPWRHIKAPEPIKNVDYCGIRNYIESLYGITGAMKIDDALNLEFQKQAFHPVKDYLESLKWDGAPRIDRLLIDYFGADDNIYTREAIRKMLVGAVARVYRPGVKFDLVLTLISDKQGTGKSTFISKLGRGWSSDSFHTFQGNAAFEQLQGAWLIEMAELSGMRKTDVEAIKHFITKQEDTYRPAYGRIVETFKRKCVFFASTNEREFLRDPSGNRRFMPVLVEANRVTKDVFSSSLDREIDQIWAEALGLYKAGEPLFLSPRAEAIARIKQGDHSQLDDRQGLVVEYLDTLLPRNWDSLDIYERRTFLTDPLSTGGTEERQYVCVAEVWTECLGKSVADMDRYKTRGLNDILRGLDGWEPANKTRLFPLYGKQKYFQRTLF